MSTKVLAYETADAFVEALSPTGALLGTASPDQLIFRGHADATWSLLPSVFRAGVAATNAEQVRAEASLLREFLRFADQQGLAISDESAELRSELIRAAESSSFLDTMHAGSGGLLNQTVWPQGRMFGLMALAQHHGLLTRMLDWTGHPFTAAYFAAAEAVRGAFKSIAVWVFDVEKARRVLRFHHQGSLEVVTVPYASNENARAQQGLFTVEARVSLVSDGAVDVTPVEGWFAAVADEDNPLLKLVLPASEAGLLLERLARHRISAATMYPGYDGAARAVREKARWK
jgi:hypothetical protein